MRLRRDAVRDTMGLQVLHGSADHQLHGEQPPGDDAFMRRQSQAEAHVDPVFHPIADTILELHVGNDSDTADNSSIKRQSTGWNVDRGPTMRSGR